MPGTWSKAGILPDQSFADAMEWVQGHLPLTKTSAPDAALQMNGVKVLKSEDCLKYQFLALNVRDK